MIKQCIEECEARIEIGLHYNIPYPRPVSINLVTKCSAIPAELSLDSKALSSLPSHRTAFLDKLVFKCCAKSEPNKVMYIEMFSLYRISLNIG